MYGKKYKTYEKSKKRLEKQSGKYTISNQYIYNEFKQCIK